MSNTAKSDLDIFPAEIKLSIVKSMDLRSIRNFMLTCTKHRDLVLENQTSLCVDMARRYIVPPAGPIFDSVAVKTNGFWTRGIIQPGAFKFIAELELRDRRIDRITSYFPNLVYLVTLSGFGHTTKEIRSRMIPLVRRTLWHCDAISDIAARVLPVPRDVDTSGMDERERWAHEALCNDMEAVHNEDPYRFLAARHLQIGYVQALADLDLAMLLLVSAVLGSNYARVHEAAHHLGAHVGQRAKERITVFEETALRHGSWFLWDEMCGDAEMRRHAKHMIEMGCRELVEFEDGNPFAPSGLKMTLMKECRARFLNHLRKGRNVRPLKVINTTWDVVKRAIGQPTEDQVKEGTRAVESLSEEMARMHIH
ncbi:hypothetical protein F4810DRAFT_708810 [Camillea tinctor]|nr:hypothetical protein F4810DRAFT_708810 [Camillea tinctor]